MPRVSLAPNCPTHRCETFPRSGALSKRAAISLRRRGFIRWLDLERNLIYFGRTKNRKLKVVPMNSATREAVAWFLNNGKGEFLVT